MSKKVLILSSFPAPYRVQVFEQLKKIYDVDVFFATCEDQNRDKKFFVSKEQLKYYVVEESEDRAYFQKCVRDLEKYDFVLAYDWYLPYAIKVEQQCIRKKIPYYINCDGALLPSKQNLKDRIKGIIKSWIVKNAAGCLASGKYASEYFKYYGASENQIAYHNFSSLRKSDIQSEVIDELEKKEIRNKLGIADKLTVLTIGQFIPRKGFDVLIKSWKDLDKECQLIILGGGDEKQQYEKMIEQYGYNHVIMKDYLPKDIVFEYYRAADLFVLPTREDIWGLVINEAMANGLPVVTTNRCVAGCELIEEGTNGYIVPVEDIDCLYEAMKKVLYEDDKATVGTNNIKKIQPYTIENVVQQHVDFFEKERKVQ